VTKHKKNILIPYLIFLTDKTCRTVPTFIGKKHHAVHPSPQSADLKVDSLIK